MCNRDTIEILHEFKIYLKKINIQEEARENEVSACACVCAGMKEIEREKGKKRERGWDMGEGGDEYYHYFASEVL